MANDANALKKLFPKDQPILGEMFDPEMVAAIAEAQDETAFPVVDRIEAQFQCPSCGYEWNGQPRPKRADDDEDQEEA